MAKKTKKQLLGELTADVEDLGRVRADAAKLDACERELAKRVRAGLDELGLESCESAGYVAQYDVRTSLTIDAKKFRSIAGEDAFLACARVDAKAARLKLDERQLARCSTTSTSKTLRTSARAEPTEPKGKT